MVGWLSNSQFFLKRLSLQAGKKEGFLPLMKVLRNGAGENVFNN